MLEVVLCLFYYLIYIHSWEHTVQIDNSNNDVEKMQTIYFIEGFY